MSRFAIECLVILALAVGSMFALHHYGQTRYKAGQAAQLAVDREIADQQRERNRDLQRSAEKKYTVQTEVRDRFFTETILEVRHEAAPLATCPVPESLRLRLNEAAACARQDRPASCSVGDEVRGAP